MDLSVGKASASTAKFSGVTAGRIITGGRVLARARRRREGSQATMTLDA